LAAGPGDSVVATTRASDEGHLRIRQVERDGTSKLLMEDARDPAISPQGDRMAMVHLVGERFQVWVATGPKWNNPEQLTEGRGHAAVPVWSPDGRRVAFLTRSVRDPIQFSRRYGDTQLWTVDLEGNATQMTAGDPIEMARPVWNADGIYVLSSQLGKDRFESVLWKVVPKAAGVP
jgi:Tol biopolymer transport system component